MGLHLHIDPVSGIAGDMFLGAMIDLGVSLDDLRAALSQVPTALPYSLSAERVLRKGIGAVDFKVHVGVAEAVLTPVADVPHLNVKLDDDTSHHHTRYRDIVAMIPKLDTTPRGRDRARRVLDALAQAEARVHGTGVDTVHFHEVGAVDSIVDMLGSMAALELLGVDTLSCGALPISRGFVRCDHGKMPVPAPATAYLLEGKPTFGVDRNVELITPTGAAIVAAVCDTFGPPPPMVLQKVGYGAGDRDDADVPNVVRLFLSERR